jgi:hypothetical protein
MNLPVPRPPSQALQRVLESAARLQLLVPDAILVGGTASALHAGHRDSMDHDHVLIDLNERYTEILDAVESSEGWATSVRASSPPMTILGSLDGIPAGLRQMRRTRPLETCDFEVGPGLVVRAPTAEESLRVKAYLVVQRNQVRDYLDVVALADAIGRERAAQVLNGINSYYSDRSATDDSVLTSLVAQLSDPKPRDIEVIENLDQYKGLQDRWQNWDFLVAECQALAVAMVDGAT